MKALIVFALLLSSATIQAQDAPYFFDFDSVWGSDGGSRTTPQEKSCFIFDHIWADYIFTRELLNKPLPHISPKSNQAFTISKYGRLLAAMAELRAFTAQNKGSAKDSQKAEIARMDQVLRSLNLYWYHNCLQGMVNYCTKKGSNKILLSLKPILQNDDGTPRPIPSRY
jgi:hypothetical protein